MRFILITPPGPVADEHLLINLMFEKGLPVLHLRKPGFDHEQLSWYLEKISPEYHECIVIHSCYELVNDFNLRGLHITGVNIWDKKGIINRYKNKDGFTISVSCHALEELYIEEPVIDYIFLSPIFDSISKKNYKAQFNHAELKEALKMSKIGVIALGGVRAENICEVKELGFQGGAFLGAVWNTDDPLKSYLAVQNEIKKIE